MAQILALLGRILGLVSSVLTIVQQILGFTSKAAQENSPFSIETAVQEILAVVTDPAFGNQGLNQTLSEIYNLITSSDTVLLAAIGTPQQAGDPVTLPTTPPAGYGGSLSAAAVWDYPLASSNGAFAADVLCEAGNMALWWGSAQTPIPLSSSSGILAYNTWQQFPTTLLQSVPGVDTSTILSSDATLQAWWDRVNPSYPTQFLDALGRPVFYSTNPSDGSFYVVDIPAWLFPYIRDGIAPGSTGYIRKAYPGPDNVTYQTTIPISGPMQLVTGPFDGLEIGFDPIPDKLGYFDFGDVKSYRHLGGVAFYNGGTTVYEPYQLLGFQRAVYMPLYAFRPDGASLRFAEGVTGNIYPFDLNPV